MTDQSPEGVNVPLLRKAVEWAEAEAMKPPELCEWEQNWWLLTPEERVERQRWASDPDYYTAAEMRAYFKAPECGTCYCIAGFVASSQGCQVGGYPTADTAAELLGLDDDDAGRLFDGDNTIEDVRRIAEELAGERL